MATTPKSLSPDASRKSIRKLRIDKAPVAGAVPLSRTISVSEAKTHLLSVLNDLQNEREPITITRRGQPVAQIIPFNPPARPTGYGALKGTVTITGDIVSPDHEAWAETS